MVSFLKLIRWPNLVIIALVQYLLRFSIIESLNVPHALNHFYYALGVICSIALAAAGYIVNDINDLANDRHNKPQRIVVGKKISEQWAWNFYFAFNIIAIFCGYFLALEVGMEDLWFIPVIAAALLYLYAIDLKQRPLLGNFVVSLLTAMPVFLVAIFDILPAANAENAKMVKQVFNVIMGYSLFAFWINFIREMVKDAEDYKGDAKEGFRTLAVIIGPKNIRLVAFALALVLLAATGYFNYILLPGDKISGTYVALFVNAPLLYFLIRIFKAKSQADFKKLSSLLKIIMLTGILSMVVFTFAIKVAFA